MPVEANDLKNFSWYKGNLLWLRDRTIFLTRHGSTAYGTATLTSDLDLKGIAIPPKEYWLGFLNSFEQAETKGDPDVVVFGIKKFFELAAKCNPSIIEILFTHQNDWIIPDRNNWGAWKLLYQARDQFLSLQARHTFSGYAMAQLKRIRTHRRWLLNPPAKKPERSDYGLDNSNGSIGREQLGVIESKIHKIEDMFAGMGKTKDLLEAHEQEIVEQAVLQLDLHKNLIPLIMAERRYKNSCRNWDSYQTWKTDRNVVRSKLEAQFGYDTKHGMHLVRLMRMCKEILTEGRVYVKRPDAEELLAIRGGAWTYDQLMEWAEAQDQAMTEAAATSKLPHEPDRKALDSLLVRMVEAAL